MRFPIKRYREPSVVVQGTPAVPAHGRPRQQIPQLMTRYVYT